MDDQLPFTQESPKAVLSPPPNFMPDVPLNTYDVLDTGQGWPHGTPSSKGHRQQTNEYVSKQTMPVYEVPHIPSGLHTAQGLTGQDSSGKGL
jgi:hypothetical protein